MIPRASTQSGATSWRGSSLASLASCQIPCVHPPVVRSGATIVACLGSSSTAGKGQAFDWVAQSLGRSHEKKTSAIFLSTKTCLAKSWRCLVVPSRAYDFFRSIVTPSGFSFFRKSPDEVAQMSGRRFHSDGIHLNSRGGMIGPISFRNFSTLRLKRIDWREEVCTVSSRCTSCRDLLLFPCKDDLSRRIYLE
jgi:hypothetical protein